MTVGDTTLRFGGSAAEVHDLRTQPRGAVSMRLAIAPRMQAEE